MSDKAIEEELRKLKESRPYKLPPNRKEKCRKTSFLATNLREAANQKKEAEENRKRRAGIK